MKPLLRVLLTTTLIPILGIGTAQVTVNPVTPCPFNISATLIHPTCPGGQDAEIALSVSNADGTVDYEWLNDNSPSTNVTDQAEELFAGSYAIRISDGSGCADTVSLELTDPEPLGFDLIPDNVECAGSVSGSILVAPEEGSGNLFYSIETSITAQTSPVFENLRAGTYTVTVEDENGCSFEQLTTISEPDSLRTNLFKQDVSCPGEANGIIEIVTTGGTGFYRHSLDGVNYTQENSFDGLQGGEYVVRTKDQNECITAKSIFLEEPEVPTANIVIDEATCHGGNNAQMIIIIESGVFAQGAYEFSLNESPFQSDSVFTDLGAGEYDVQIKTPANCISAGIITIGEPEEVESNITIDSVSCPSANDAQMIIIIESGVFFQEQYEFSLDGVNYQSDSLFSDLAPGEYQIYSQDPNGCIKIDEVSISAPAETDINIKVDSVSCPGGMNGQMIIIIESGVFFQGQYQYSIDGINFQTDSIFKNLPAGPYTAFVMDPNGCIFSMVTQIEEPTVPLLTLQIQDIKCYGDSDGALTIIANSGASPSDLEFSLNGIDFQQETVFEQLSEGDYTLYTRFANDCLFFNYFSIHQPDSLACDLSIENETCSSENGWMNCDVSGGTGTYQYLWSTGGETATISDLSQGYYQVTISDNNGCQLNNGFFLENEAAPLIQANVFMPSCFESNDGVINLKVISSQNTLTYIWSNGEITQDIHHLSDGKYSVTVTDENACNTIRTFEIQDPKPLSIDEQISYSNYAGNIVITAEGGTAPYQYLWSNGLEIGNISNLEEGDYGLTITDDNGCSSNKLFTLEPPIDPEQEEVGIYPIPTMNQLFIDLHLSEEQLVNIRLLDIRGVTLIKKAPQRIQRRLLQLDLKHLEGALYYLIVELDNEVISRKVVKVTD